MSAGIAKRAAGPTIGVRQKANENCFVQPTKPLTPAEHFERVGRIISEAVRLSRLAAELQESARLQLEVAEFSIDRILAEVADVMVLTAEMAALRKPVPVAEARALRFA